MQRAQVNIGKQSLKRRFVSPDVLVERRKCAIDVSEIRCNDRDAEL